MWKSDDDDDNEDKIIHKRLWQINVSRLHSNPPACCTAHQSAVIILFSVFIIIIFFYHSPDNVTDILTRPFGSPTYTPHTTVASTTIAAAATTTPFWMALVCGLSFHGVTTERRAAC